MRIALYIAHAYLPADVLARYRAALSPHTLTVVPVVRGEGYPTYQREAATLRAARGTVWRGIRAALPEADLYVVAGFSAGGALLRELLRGEDAERDRECAAVVSLDASYASEVSPGVPLAAHMAPWVDAARRAREGGPVLAMGASEVDPVAYASTDEVLRALATSAAVSVGDYTYTTPVPHRNTRVAEGPGFVLRWYAGRDAAGHSAALREWGPVLVAEAVAMALSRRSSASTEPPPTEPAPTLPTGAAAPATEPVRPGTQANTGGARTEARPRGIDVSRAQGPGEQNAWDRWAQGRDAIQFGAARASSGATVDPTFFGNWRGMGTALDLRIAYHYVNGRPVADQLAAFSHALIDAITVGVPSALDIEPWDPAGRVTADWVAAMAADRCAIPLALYDRLGDLTGRPPLVYSARWAIDCVPGLTAALVARGAEWWVADASAAARAAGHPVLGLPRGVELASVRIWQRGTRLAEGEPAPVDDDVWLGSLDSLRAWARG